MKEETLSALALEIKKDWKNMYFGAVPYLDAMRTMSDVKENYGYDSGREIVMYFLANAGSWRGPVAREIKAELKRRLK